MKIAQNTHIDAFYKKIIILRDEEELEKTCRVFRINRVSLDVKNFPMILYKDRGCFSISEITNENVEKLKEDKFKNLIVCEMSSIEMNIC